LRLQLFDPLLPSPGLRLQGFHLGLLRGDVLQGGLQLAFVLLGSSDLEHHAGQGWVLLGFVLG